VLRKLAVVLSGTVLALMLLPSAAFAQQDYVPAGGALGVSASEVSAGGSLTISGDGCASSATVDFAVAGAAAGSTTADASGVFSGDVTIPNGASGPVDVTATCAGPDGESVVLTATVNVAAAGTGTGSLPRTGSSSSFPTVAVALILLCVGAAFVVATRRRAVSRTPVSK
jgi:LPXTG-motif cell wall-anchored protein